MKYTNASNVILTLIIILTITCTSSICDDRKDDKYSLSVPMFIMSKNEKVVEFKVKVKNGFVISVPRIPPGWFLTIKLPTQSETVVYAGSIIGVADLDSEEISYFKNFLSIQTNSDNDSPLDIAVEIVTTNNSQNQRSIICKINDLILTKLQ